MVALSLLKHACGHCPVGIWISDIFLDVLQISLSSFSGKSMKMWNTFMTLCLHHHISQCCVDIHAKKFYYGLYFIHKTFCQLLFFSGSCMYLWLDFFLPSFHVHKLYAIYFILFWAAHIFPLLAKFCRSFKIAIRFHLFSGGLCDQVSSFQVTEFW